MLAEVLHEIVELLDRAKVLAPGELAELHAKVDKATETVKAEADKAEADVKDATDKATGASSRK